ncbi:intradiol ring-cleavage dioxygenase [Microbacterium sp. 13-71-7]|jgi:protocatechuate 3,4-dioxygenase beta subunit|uniref:intradiol ring-cleavage dioxygenase n=1 Tax=Microbacterium sp. 13-71-7 TaxID=1970399 RepID=UPI000BDAB906|nr:intradiol ring-cleavage dioxygenase [Microbacterium sp. 13-71-7]OZB84147.1 MAG: 3,4-dioxygenase subunit beta [Microbacterium sp. 13-71-7]
MSTFPDPTRTPDGPAYEGRLLDRPEEEVVDQGAPFDIRTLMTRRTVLSLVGLGAGGAVLAACTPIASGAASTATSSAVPTVTSTPAASASSAPASAVPAAEIPDETAGPYPGDGSNGPDALTDSGIVRQDIRSSIGGGTTAAGVPLTFSLNLLDMANGDAPFAGVAVYAWHCDAAGGYSMYSSGIQGETYLRGVQVADADGRVSFTSVFPGCYSGRWPHIHFEVYPSAAAVTDAANAIATSQLALPQSACEAVYATAGYDGSAQNLAQTSLSSDNVFGDDGGALQIAALTGDAASGFTATLTVRVDTRTAPTGGSMGGGPR